MALPSIPGINLSAPFVGDHPGQTLEEYGMAHGTVGPRPKNLQAIDPAAIASAAQTAGPTEAPARKGGFAAFAALGLWWFLRRKRK